MWLGALRRYVIPIAIIIRITAGITILTIRIILPCHFHLDLEITAIMAAITMEGAITMEADTITEEAIMEAPIGAAPRRVAFTPVVLRWAVSVEAEHSPVIIDKSVKVRLAVATLSHSVY